MSNHNIQYLHGFTKMEAERLLIQAKALSPFIQSDTQFPPNSKVLEVGCGVGAQTILLAQRYPNVQFEAIDHSGESIEKANTLVQMQGITNIHFKQADLLKLPYPPESFDCIISSFVFEHIEDPVGALRTCQKAIKKEGSITLIEGEHDSVYYYPENNEMNLVWNSYARLHQSYHGDPHIGRKLYPLLKQAGFRDIQISPCVVYMDGSKPELMKSILEETILAAFDAVKEDALKQNILDARIWNKGINDFYELAINPEAVFCYTWLKAKAKK